MNVTRYLTLWFLISLFTFSSNISPMYADETNAPTFQEIEKKLNIEGIDVIYFNNRFDSILKGAEASFEKEDYKEASDGIYKYMQYVSFPDCEVLKMQEESLRKIGKISQAEQYGLRYKMCMNEENDPDKKTATEQEMATIEKYMATIDYTDQDEHIYASKRFSYLNINKKLYNSDSYTGSKNVLYHFTNIVAIRADIVDKEGFSKEDFIQMIDSQNIDNPTLLQQYAGTFNEEISDSEKIEISKKILSYESIPYDFAPLLNSQYYSSHQYAYERLSLDIEDLDTSLYYAIRALDSLKNSKIFDQELYDDIKSKYYPYLGRNIGKLLLQDSEYISYINPYIGDLIDKDLSTFLDILINSRSDQDEEYLKNVFEKYSSLKIETKGLSKETFTVYIIKTFELECEDGNELFAKYSFDSQIDCSAENNAQKGEKNNIKNMIIPIVLLIIVILFFIIVMHKKNVPQ